MLISIGGVWDRFESWDEVIPGRNCVLLNSNKKTKQPHAKMNSSQGETHLGAKTLM